MKVIEFEEQFTGRRQERIDMDDDYGGLFSPELYEEFNYPYMKRIYEIHEFEGKGLHTETLSRDHLKFIKRLGITDYDAWPYHGLTVEDVLEELPDIYFTWNIATAKDLYADTPDKIREKYAHLVEGGAPGILMNLCDRGVPRENIKAFIDASKKFENR